jgi:hypothetical protein
LPRVDFVIEPEGCHLDFATSGFVPFSDMARCPTSARKGKADIGEIETMARDGLGRSGRLTHLVRRNRVAEIGVGFRRLHRRATRAQSTLQMRRLSVLMA